MFRIKHLLFYYKFRPKKKKSTRQGCDVQLNNSSVWKNLCSKNKARKGIRSWRARKEIKDEIINVNLYAICSHLPQLPLTTYLAHGDLLYALQQRWDLKKSVNVQTAILQLLSVFPYVQRTDLGKRVGKVHKPKAEADTLGRKEKNTHTQKNPNLEQTSTVGPYWNFWRLKPMHVRIWATDRESTKGGC